MSYVVVNEFFFSLAALIRDFILSMLSLSITSSACPASITVSRMLRKLIADYMFSNFSIVIYWRMFRMVSNTLLKNLQNSYVNVL
jgi:hypothetical protein